MLDAVKPLLVLLAIYALIKLFVASSFGLVLFFACVVGLGVFAALLVELPADGPFVWGWQAPAAAPAAQRRRDGRPT